MCRCSCESRVILRPLSSISRITPFGNILPIVPSSRFSTLNSLLDARRDDIGAHHLVVFMFHHVAVPNVAPRAAFETDDDAGDGEGVDAGDVLPAELVGGKRDGGAGKDD